MTVYAERPKPRRVALKWLVAIAVAGVLTAGCGSQPSPTPLPSSTPTVPIPTATSSFTPTPTSTATPASPSPFSTLPLEPQGHAAVMIAAAVPHLERLGDAPRYQIAATFDPEEMALRGTERVRMVNRSDQSMDKVYFRLYPNASSLYGPAVMELLSAKDDWGRSLQWHEGSDDSVVGIEIGDTWNPGEALMLNLTWEAQIPVEGSLAWTRDDGYGIFRQANGLAVLAEWFPMLALHDGTDWRLDRVPDWGDPVYSEIAFFEVWLTAPKSHTVIATGMEVSATEESNTVVRQYLSGPARDFFLAFSSELWTASATVGGTQVKSYAFPDDASGGNTALAASVDALQVFNRRFDVYPYREVEVLEAPLLGLLGMEYPGVVLLSDNIYIPSQRWRLDVTTAHEIAHQWWYGVVGSDILREPWLDEALATYASGIYVDDVMGRVSFQQQYEGWVERYEGGFGVGTKGAVVWPVERFRGSWDYVTTVYYKGAIALRMLRNEIGDEAFFGALRRYYEEFTFRQARGDDLLRLFEQISGRDLQDLYSTWWFSE